ncbi:binding-protein-dependent transport systems inner membrane component [Beutenbergia cavernae DSM 12333]|uniref:Binding-protein-dependent transport systems inner membrane component n=1 Tax=Beutenbergia cavernae (strain ATCC BAA-8 / DSM 12333 / CCUG 43141 / JCM 11478 / NBRC 16432 / NCIMB 13614 / HKI 0122) TaxID=471853 RepID=C5C3V6_BEUC1|nr:carbohydrate ABC transporter permease [Beutenbergia cavernae]ACQ82015.1 binding-protein-dependent transport systems inner membrane component [Beutenbergia cavernae DSM 12333]
MSTARLTKSGAGALRHVVLAVASIAFVFPLAWIILSSVKTGAELANNPLDVLPDEFTLANYRRVLEDLGFLQNLRNSVLIAVVATAVTIVLSTLAAYGIVRFFPRFGQRLTRVLIATYMFPPILLAVPYAAIMVKLGLINTYAGLILAYLSFALPYAIWMLVGFYQTVPLEIEEGAQMDGAGKVRIFWQIATPIVLPGIVATAVYTFINTFNEFLYALLFINSTDRMPVAVALYSLTGSEVLDWGAMMAASVLVVVPSVLFFMSIQKYIAGGLAEGSVK